MEWNLSKNYNTFSDIPNALITGTDRTLHVAVMNAPHFFKICVNTHPTGEQPSTTSILKKLNVLNKCPFCCGY